MPAIGARAVPLPLGLGLGLGLALALALAACGGGDPEPEYRWEEETVYEPPGQDRDEDAYEGRPSRSDAATDHYGAPRRSRGAEGAIYSPKRGIACDESVGTCYAAKGGHAEVTEQQFGEAAARRLSRRIEEEGQRGARAIVRPADGVVCDRLSEVCYDRGGASLRETRREFGGGAAEALVDRIDAPRTGPGRRRGMIFSPRKDVSCDEQVAACYLGDAAHPGHTKQQFGAEAARALERRLELGRGARDGIYRPGGGAVCDRLAEVCYDRSGASAKRTRQEFGRQAAVRLSERLE